MTSRELKEEYSWLNENFFRGKLPDIPVSFGEITEGRDSRRKSRKSIHARTYYEAKSGSHERFRPVEIRLAAWISRKNFRRYAFITLVHEMIHAELGYRYGCKNRNGKFAQRVSQLTRRGILDRAV